MRDKIERDLFRVNFDENSTMVISEEFEDESGEF